MRHLVCTLLVTCVILPQIAAAEDALVPVEKAAFHHPIFHNEYVLLLDVYVPPNRGGPMYHTHSLDQVSVLIADSDMTNQVWGGEATPPRRGMRGNVGFAANSKKPVSHRGFNVGSTPFHNIVMALLKNEPYGLSAGTRTSAPAYAQVLDNERVRAWKISLEPGEAVPAITQMAPGMRIVLDGGEITEYVPGDPDRGKMLRTGQYFWQDAGVTRAIRNTGATKVQFVEIELK